MQILQLLRELNFNFLTRLCTHFQVFLFETDLESRAEAGRETSVDVGEIVEKLTQLTDGNK